MFNHISGTLRHSMIAQQSVLNCYFVFVRHYVTVRHSVVAHHSLVMSAILCFPAIPPFFVFPPFCGCLPFFLYPSFYDCPSFCLCPPFCVRLLSCSFPPFCGCPPFWVADYSVFTAILCLSVILSLSSILWNCPAYFQIYIYAISSLSRHIYCSTLCDILK